MTTLPRPSRWQPDAAGCVALSALGILIHPTPGRRYALPWAILWQAFSLLRLLDAAQQSPACLPDHHSPLT